MSTVVTLRRLSTRLLAVAVLITLAGFYGAYGIAARLSLGTQVISHIVLMIGPGLGKLGYVLRLAAEDEERRSVHSAPPVSLL
ncbi:MAG: hypothetical protein JO142_00905 [Burkholderiales bacterium]|nr:hypothetical protein [Burkholderiales bacterium]